MKKQKSVFLPYRLYNQKKSSALQFSLFFEATPYHPIQRKEAKKKKDLDCILELDPIKKRRNNVLKLNESHLWLRVRSRKELRWFKLCKPVGLAALLLI